MTAKSDELVNELVSAAIAFGRGQLPDWQTRIETAKRELLAHIDEVEGLEEDSGSYDSLIPDWANEPKQRWIPVSERLPDNWKSVLTIDMSESTRGMVSAFYNPKTSLWVSHFSDDLWVTHWMPSPELPIVYGKVCEE